MTGFPSVDVRSIGAGGGSIAARRRGGLLRVGPASAGAVPGPACYGQGGARPTVTDAALVLGYLDPDFFLGGRLRLDVGGRRRGARARTWRRRSASTLDEAAAAVLNVVTENMVGAIEEITVNQGIDPRSAMLVGGGGAAGLNAVALARRLGCPRVIIPDVAAALSAAGALMSDLTAEFAHLHLTTAGQFDGDGVNAVLADLEERCRQFAAGPGARARATAFELLGGGALRAADLGVRGAAARLPRRRRRRPRGAGRRLPRRAPGDLRHRRSRLRDRVRDVAGARAVHAARLRDRDPRSSPPPRRAPHRRSAHFDGHGRVSAAVVSLAAMDARRALRGAGHRRVAGHHRRGRPGRGGPADPSRQPGDHAVSGRSRAATAGRIDGVRLAVLSRRIDGIAAQDAEHAACAPARSGVINTAATSRAAS